MLYTSLFGELTKSVQIRIDKASELKKQLFDQALFENYLDWDAPQIGLTFEELIGSYGLSIAAATLDSRGNAPIIGTEGLETIADKVLLHKIGYSLKAQDYRKVLQLLDSKSIADREKAQTLINLMFKNVKDSVDGVNSKLDIIFLGALSNKGIFTFDASNNPSGGVRGTVDMKMPEGNTATVDTSWTEENIDTVDCWNDIQEMVDLSSDTIKPAKMLLNRAKLSYMLRNKAMKQVIFGTDKKNTPLLTTQFNEFLANNEMPVVEVVRRSCRVMNGKVLTEVTPWNGDNIVFVPEGKLGIVKNAYADSELRPEAGIAYSNYGRIRISQFGSGEREGGNAAETTVAQVFALPVITEINACYSLTTIK